MRSKSKQLDPLALLPHPILVKADSASPHIIRARTHKEVKFFDSPDESRYQEKEKLRLEHLNKLESQIQRASVLL